MRVLLIVDETLIESAHAIVVRRLQELLPHLSNRGMQIAVATLRNGGDTHAQLEKMGVPAFSLGARRNALAPLAAIRLARLLRRECFDVVHSQEVIPAIVAGIAGRFCRKGALVFVREHSTGGWRLTLASRLAAILNNVTVCVSKHVAHCAQTQDRTPVGRLEVVYNGVEKPAAVSDEEVSLLRDRMDVPPGAPVVVSVARMRREKGLDVLVRAMSIVASSSGREPHLILVGQGPEEDRLRRLVADGSNFKTHFVGHQEDVARWYAIADVVAIPSLKEAFGFTAIEGMACGKPVVASRVGGLSEIVDEGVTGLLAQPGDAASIADCLLLLIEDPGLKAKMGTAASERYEDHFTIDAMAEGWRRVWSKLGAQTRADAPTG